MYITLADFEIQHAFNCAGRRGRNTSDYFETGHLKHSSFFPAWRGNNTDSANK